MVSLSLICPNFFFDLWTGYDYTSPIYFLNRHIMDIKTFEQIKRVNEYHQDYRKARELSKILEYSEYRHFKPVIEKAKMACVNS